MHREFAEIYDIFMKHVNYKDWYRFLKTYIGKSGEILDLGCGTGEFIWRLLKDSFSVTGIDISHEMLNVAERKISRMNLKNCDYKLICENMVNYSHPHKVDYIICNFDTVNYLRDRNEFKKFLQKSNENLKDGGYLIFDIITEGIFEEIFENGIFIDEEPEYTSIWRYEKKGSEKYFIEIDLFIRQGEENLFKKYNEQHNKFIYEPEWVVKNAEKHGFKIFDVATNNKFGESRIFFVFKKDMKKN